MRGIKTLLGLLLLLACLPSVPSLFLGIIALPFAWTDHAPEPLVTYGLVCMPLIGIAASIVLMTKIRGTTFLILGLVFFLLLLPAFVGISSEEYEQVSWWEYAIPSAYAAIWFALGLYDVIRSEKAAHAPK